MCFFFFFVQGMFRDKGVVILMSSPTQAISVDHENEVSGTGKKNRLAQFRVHKVSEGGIRMFESIASPGKYLRVKQGKIDCQVSVCCRVKNASMYTMNPVSVFP